MAGFGKFIFSVDLRSLLCARSCLVKIPQNYSKDATMQASEVELPCKPKKPVTSFLLYTKTIRPQLLERKPDMKAFEIIKEASKEWANLDPALKKDFKSQYDENYKKYVNDLKHYEESLTDEHRLLLEKKKKESKRRSAALDIKQKMVSFQKPRKPANGFLMYLHAQKSARNPQMSVKEWVSESTRQWTQMSDVEKRVYIDDAAKLMKQYKEDLAKWEEEMIKLGHPDIVRRSRSSRKLSASATKEKAETLE